MKNFLIISFIFCLLILVPSISLAQTNNPYPQLRQLIPSSSPATPVPPPPGPPPPAVPPPPGAPPPGTPPPPPDTPPVTESPLKLCDSLVGIQVPQWIEFIYLTVSDDFIRINKDDYLRELQKDNNYSKLSSDFSGKTDDIINYYRQVVRSFYHSPEFRLPIATSIKQQVKGVIAQVGRNNYPPIPFLVLNTAFTGDAYADQYPPAQTINEALGKLGCTGATPKLSTAFSPYIYLYPTSETAVQVKIGREVTYSSPDYSLINGFHVYAKPEGTRLYYEFGRDNSQLAASSYQSKNNIIVKAEKIKDYLFNNLLPKLGLTNQELTDYQQEITNQLKNINIDQNYQIILLQNQEVDNLIPLSITPKPDTIIRNMIIIRPTSYAPTTPYTLYPIPYLRPGFTLVENGFMMEEK